MALFLPTGERGRKGGRRRRRRRDQRRDDAGTPSITWRVQLRMARRSRRWRTVLVDDASGAARAMPDPLAGDRAAQWIRWLHEGSNSGPVWRFVVFLTGAFPPIFVVTGVIMWLRGRRQRRALAGLRAGEGKLQAAE